MLTKEGAALSLRFSALFGSCDSLMRSAVE